MGEPQILFGVGSLFLVLTGLVGVEGFGNIPVLLIGTACMISGSVFVGSSLIVDTISGKAAQADTVQASTSKSDNDRSSFLDDGDTPSDGSLSVKGSLVAFGVIVIFLLVIALVQ